MDIQTALRIMELSPSAGREDLQEAFRRLAKRYHPDRVKYSPERMAGDDRMKEINLAFNLLKKELKSARPEETVDAEKPPPADKSGESVFSFVRNWKKSFSQKRKSSQVRSENKDRPRTGRAFANRTRRCQANRRKKSFRQEFYKSFRAAAGNEAEIPGRPRARRCRDRTVYNYAAYMKLKKRMASPAQRRESDPGPVGPVTRISRIKRVEK